MSSRNDRAAYQPSEKDLQLASIIQPLDSTGEEFDQLLGGLERSLEQYDKDYSLNLSPDFQRGHVWSVEQQVALIEGMLRKTVPRSTLVIQFNAPHFKDYDYSGELPREMQILDGLHRLTAIRKFIAGEFKAFGSLSFNDLEGSRFDMGRSLYTIKFSIHGFTTRAELLRYYLAFNSGGTVHSKEEIERVRLLLDESEQ